MRLDDCQTKTPFEASFTESQVCSTFLNSVCFHVLGAIWNSVHSLTTHWQEPPHMNLEMRNLIVLKKSGHAKMSKDEDHDIFKLVMTRRAERSDMIRHVNQPSSFPVLAHPLAVASHSPGALWKHHQLMGSSLALWISPSENEPTSGYF